MTNGLNGTQTKILTWLVYALITFLTVSSANFYFELNKIKKDYVSLEQYRVDERQTTNAMCRLESKIDQFSNRINDKLDKIIMRQP